MRNICKIHLLDTEYMKFRDFYKRAAKVIKYEELPREESQRKKTSMGTYCHEVNYEEITVADLLSTCLLLVKKTHDLWKKSQTFNTQVQYTFNVAKTDEIFDFLIKEKL